MGPINYILPSQSFGKRFEQGLRPFQIIQQMDMANKQQANLNEYKANLKSAMQSENKQEALNNVLANFPSYAQTTQGIIGRVEQQNYRNDLNNALQSNNPDDMVNLSLRYPNQNKAIKARFANLDAQQKQQQLNEAGEFYNLLQNNEVDLAKTKLKEKIEAGKNSNVDTSKWESTLNTLEQNPKLVKGMLNFTLANLMDKDSYKNFMESSKVANYKTLSNKEKSDLGLDPKLAYQISPNGQITKITGSGGEIGETPAGYERITGEDGSISLRPIKGSPQQKKIDELRKKEVKAKEQLEASSGIVLSQIDIAENLIKKNPLIAGRAEQFVPAAIMQERVDTEKAIDTIKASIAFDKLMEMKAASPTGGALGSVTENELKLLQASLGSLDLEQSDKSILANLKQIKNYYNNIIRKVDTEAKDFDKKVFPTLNQGKGQSMEQKEDNRSDEDILKQYGLQDDYRTRL